MDGAILSLCWCLPFLGILISIAFFPTIVPRFWHAHYGKVSLFWGVLCVLSILHHFGHQVTLHTLVHVYGEHYIPFILLISCLYVVSTAIHVEIQGTATPFRNCLFLALTALSANFLGTVGSAMIFIRPFLSMNRGRQHKTHSLIFFIFLVCNIGGCLTAVGDPPLFLGFLNGVDFFWPLRHLLGPLLLVGFYLLAVYYAIDTYYARRENLFLNQKSPVSIRLKGGWHLFFLPLIIAFIVYSGSHEDPVMLHAFGVDFSIPSLIRDFALLGIAVLSYVLGARQRAKNNASFQWEPIREVALLFAGIFITAAPVIEMLKVGLGGPMASLVQMVTHGDNIHNPAAFFWLTGSLSSFLDNAPTYLIFFNLAGGNASDLMTIHKETLMAISAGSVFMGAMTYIGNAPNFMVKSLAEANRISMPSFLGFLGWSMLVLLPAFILFAWVFL